MFDIDKWIEIWHTITANKVRSIMTAFGVFWGIFMLFILLGLGNAFEGGISKSIEGFATNSCFFFTDKTSEPYKGLRKGRQWNMNNRDLALIKEKANSLEYLSPMLFGDKSAKNIVADKKSTSAQIMGVYPEFFKIQSHTIVAGRLINTIDISENRKVVLLSLNIAESLFKIAKDAVGENIRLNGIYFQVIGIVNSKSDVSLGSDPKTTIYIPFSTMQKTFNKADIIHFLGATAKPNMPVSILEEQVKTILKMNHNIAPNDQKAARSFNLEEQFKTLSNIFTGINILLWIVGLGSLLSGIIGVSNIMIVTVSERTREIGVRRALGAKPLTILYQIMSESFLLTFLAGFLGLFSGVSILEIIATIMRNMSGDLFFIPPFVSFNVAISAIIILIIAGLIAGFIPSVKALKIKAIDAIRDE